jgi:hypothetical protein
MADVMVKWRDDAAKTFINERVQEVHGEQDFIYFHTPGIFRSRQYELRFTDNEPFTLIALEEEVAVIDH